MFNWIIRISFLYFFVLVSCSESTDEPPSPPGKPQTSVNQEIKKFNEVVQAATNQFTTALNKALVQATTEFRNQTEKVLKKVEDQKKAQVELDQEALTSELNAIIQTATTRFTTDINKNLEEVTAQFRNQTEEILKKGKGDGDIAGELDAAVQTAITQLNTEIDKAANAARDNITSGIADAATEAKGDLTGGIVDAATKAKGDLTSGIADAATEAKGDLTGGIADAATEAKGDLTGGIADAATEAKGDLTGGIVDAATEAKGDLTGGIVDAATEAKGDLTGGIADAATEAKGDLTSGIAEASTATRDNVAGGIGEAATAARENVTGGIGEAATAARENIVGGIGEAATAARDNVTGGIGEAATAAGTILAAKLDKVTKAAIDRFKSKVADIAQNAMKKTPVVQTSGSSCILTEPVNTAKPIIRDAVRNLELFLDRELTFDVEAGGMKIKGVVKEVFDDREIPWEKITTEQDKVRLTDQIVSTIYNDERYKNHLTPLRSALISNIKDTIVPEEEIAKLTAEERLTLGCRINIEIKKAVGQFVEERIRYIVGKIIDVNTATEAVYTMRFDIASSLPHKKFGKPIHFFISMGEGDDEESVSLSKGDCVRIKKEYLPSITFILLYTNPATGPNFPDNAVKLCDYAKVWSLEEPGCQPGNYNIQQVRKGADMDYVLKWERPRGNSASSCQVFPSNYTL